ncbi:MAG TPA: hypothetical protein VIB39_04070 [Candidatus Angelobacter sp.]|jgi:hypothetical protein
MQRTRRIFLRKTYGLLLAITRLFTLSANATVLDRVTIKCPICGEVNSFYGFAGWGGYLYYYPSRFQMVFFPHTYPTSLWTCKKCHYTAWIGDFQDFPSEKAAAVRKALKDAPVIPEFANYEEVPMAARLAVAERIYRELGKDDLFWSYFYQVKGYHLGVCSQAEEAKQARLQAADMLKRLVGGPQFAGRKKDLLIALAAMRHYTGDDHTALETLAVAATLPNPPGADSKSDDSFLDKLIAEYREKIKSGSVPSDEHSVNLFPGIMGKHAIESGGQDQIWAVRACGK